MISSPTLSPMASSDGTGSIFVSTALSNEVDSAVVQHQNAAGVEPDVVAAAAAVSVSSNEVAGADASLSASPQAPQVSSHAQQVATYFSH